MQNSHVTGVEVVVAPLIVNNKGEILLVKSHKWGDVYLIPGGHLELNEKIFDEKIDIVRYSENPGEYITNALSPARIITVEIIEESPQKKEALVVVPNDQLSLAIGKEGQNVRLAHRLTGWKIDIKSLFQYEQMQEEYARYQEEHPEIYSEEYEEAEETQEVIEEAVETVVEEPKKAAKAKKAEKAAEPVAEEPEKAKKTKKVKKTEE